MLAIRWICGASASAIAYSLPIMIDPSHGTGKAEYVPSMALAAIAAEQTSHD